MIHLLNTEKGVPSEYPGSHITERNIKTGNQCKSGQKSWDREGKPLQILIAVQTKFCQIVFHHPSALKICRGFPESLFPSFSKLVEVSLAIGVSGVSLKVKIVDEEGHRQQSGFHLNTFVKIRGTQSQKMPKSKYKLL